jgi:hypothetical protein
VARTGAIPTVDTLLSTYRTGRRTAGGASNLIVLIKTLQLGWVGVRRTSKTDTLTGSISMVRSVSTMIS